MRDLLRSDVSGQPPEAAPAQQIAELGLESELAALEQLTERNPLQTLIPHPKQAVFLEYHSRPGIR